MTRPLSQYVRRGDGLATSRTSRKTSYGGQTGSKST